MQHGQQSKQTVGPPQTLPEHQGLFNLTVFYIYQA